MLTLCKTPTIYFSPLKNSYQNNVLNNMTRLDVHQTVFSPNKDELAKRFSLL